MKRRLLGAAMMGFGGVTALGCSVGQGVTGLSTLSVGSALATVSIIAGARVGLYILLERRREMPTVVAPAVQPAAAAAIAVRERVSCTDP